MKYKEPKIYIVAGKARHGKSTIAEIIKKDYEKRDKKVISLAYAKTIKEYIKNITNWNGDENSKPRELMQMIGTDIIRAQIDNSFHTRRMIEDIKVYSYFFDVIIISDARYEDEIMEIKNNFKDVEVVKVIRTSLETGLTDNERRHLSETALDSFDEYDHTIYNDDSLSELKNQVIEILRG
jgi:basic membrane lipoprotein Med (substrate-binding protein (PBP1-ABC) superfamily)